MMDLPLVNVVNVWTTPHRDYSLGFENMATWSSVVSVKIGFCPPLPPPPPSIEPYIYIYLLLTTKGCFVLISHYE